MWLQATSDVSGLDQIVCAKTLGASYGNAFLAACAAGLAAPDDIALWNPTARSVQARTDKVYARQYRYFRQLYDQTRDIAAGLSAV